jgi:hypothetical protein
MLLTRQDPDQKSAVLMTALKSLGPIREPGSSGSGTDGRSTMARVAGASVGDSEKCATPQKTPIAPNRPASRRCRSDIDFGCQCQVDQDVQDAGRHGRMDIPAADTGRSLVVLISNFGTLAVLAIDT